MGRWGHVLTGIAVSSAFWPGILSAVFVPRWAAIAVLVPLFMMLDVRAVPAWCWAVLAVVLGSAGLSLALSPDAMSGTYALMLAAILLLTFVAGASADSLDNILNGLGIGILASVAVTLAQDMGWTGVPRPSALPSGLFYNSEVMAEFAALVCLWACVARKWWIVFFAAGLVVGSHSRIALLTIAVGLGYLGFVRLPRRYGVVILLALIAVAILLLPVSDYKWETASHRMTLWGATVLSFEWMGNGLGWAAVTFPVERFSHSDALQLIAEIGVAALALIAIPVMVLRKGIENGALAAVFVGSVFQIMVSFPLHFPASGFVIALVTGHLLGRRDMVRVGYTERRTDHGARIRRAEAAHA